jgi:hypothetical protein
MNHRNYTWEFFDGDDGYNPGGVWIEREDDPFETGISDIWIDLDTWQKIVESWVYRGTSEEE